MDLTIAIKEERAFVCKPLAVEDSDEVMGRLEQEGAQSAAAIFNFKEGDTVIDDDDNIHVIKEIHAPIDKPEEWCIVVDDHIVPIMMLKGTVIKEVPKYHIDGLLS